MYDFIRHLFSPAHFMPHGHCYFWKPEVLWMEVIGDGLTVAAYFSIPIALLIFIRKRTDLAFSSVFYLFGLFIFLCGCTHLLGIITIWTPVYVLEGLVKILTGLVSCITAIALFRIIPVALTIPTVKEYNTAKDESNYASSAIRQVQNHVIVFLDEEGLIQSWNEQAETITGYEETDVMNQHFRLLFPEEERENQRPEALLQHARNNGVVFDESYRQKKDGSVFMANTSIIRIKNNRGKLVGFSKVMRDNSYHFQYESMLEHYISELEEKNRELSEMNYVVSHDLQSPLKTVINFTNLLNEDCEEELSDEAKGYLKVITRAVIRMQTQIRDLLDFSRIGRNLEKKDISLNNVVRNILSDLAFPINEANASFYIADLPDVRGYETEINLLFQNLISNAIKFHVPGVAPVVSISATEEGDFWKFQVKDNGIGIEEQYFSRIFEIFQRLHSFSKFEGTGIGLAQCKKIVTLHGGKIWVESQVGKGSSFYFTLPQKSENETKT